MSSENNQNKTEENSNKISNTILLTIDSIIKLKEFLNQDEIKNDYLDIDILFRHYINSKSSEDIENILLLFIPHLDINYQNQYYENSTILMYLVNEGLINLTQKLLDNFSDDIDLTILDNKKENIFFKIINCSNEQGKLNLFKNTFELLEDDKKKDIISNRNNQGQSLLELALFIGNSDITNLLINEGEKLDYKNNISNENSLHFAIKGKNPYCLKIILQNMTNDLINQCLNEKNKNGETPIQLATKMNLTPMIRLLTEAGKNKIKEEKNENNNLEIHQVTDLLCDLNSNNYTEIIKLIKDNFYLNDWNLIFIEKLSDEQEGNKINFDVLKKIVDFFDEDVKYNKDKEIYFLNYMTEAYNLSDFPEMLSIFKNYLDNKTQSDYIFFVNSILMLIDKSLMYQLNNFSQSLIQTLINFLNNYTKEDKNKKYENAFIKYLNYKEILNPSENIKEITSLYQCYLNINQNNYDKAQEYLSEFKSFYSKNKQNIKIPIYHTLNTFYHILKIRIDYFNNIQFKFFQHLTNLSSNKEINSIIFYYNSMGIHQLKQKRYSYAEYCFKFCENLIRKNESLTYCYLNNVLYNIALCYFYTKKYEKSYKILSSLKGLDLMSTNPYFFYRLGLCCLERELKEKKKNSNEENLNDIVQESLFSSENENINFKKRFILVNRTPSSFIGYDNVNEKLTEAIFAFKQALLIIKGNTFYNKEIYNTFNNCKEIEINDLKFENNDLNDNKSFQYIQIFPSIYLNLIFCLIRNENYLEAIQYCLEFRKYDSNNNYKYAIDNFLIEAYIRINEYVKALEILQKQNFSYNNIDSKGSFYTSSNQLVYNEVNYRLALCINLIKIQLLNNNFQDVEKNINSMISLLNYPSDSELPPYAINIILYYLLVTNKNELAIETLKHRRMPKFINK